MTSESLVPTDMSTTTSTEVPVTSNTQPTETTSQVPSSTTVAPDVTPATGKWNYFDNKQNVTCIMVEAAMQLNLTYVTKCKYKYHNLFLQCLFIFLIVLLCYYFMNGIS